MKFTIGENNIAYLGNQFKDWFGDMEVKGEQTLIGQKLPRHMNDFEIQKELAPSEVSLGDVHETLKTMSHETWALFYVKDSSGVLRTVSVYWYGGGWHVSADALDGHGWSADNVVFSRSSCDTKTPSDSLATGHLDPLTRIASALESIAETYRKSVKVKPKKGRK